MIVYTKLDYGLFLSTYSAHLTIQDLKVVRKALWNVRNKWHDIGIELELSVMELGNVRDQHKDDFKECLGEMVAQWLKRSDPRPTWEALVEALEEPTVGEEATALSLSKKYLNL